MTKRNWTVADLPGLYAAANLAGQDLKARHFQDPNAMVKWCLDMAKQIEAKAQADELLRKIM